MLGKIVTAVHSEVDHSPGFQFSEVAIYKFC